MGEVIYHEQDWDLQMARLSLSSGNPSTISSSTPTPTGTHACPTTNTLTPLKTRPGLKTITSLPVELLCKIFLFCLQVSPSNTPVPISTWGPPSTALVLSHVCAYWRGVALGFPWLWNCVRLDCGDWRATVNANVSMPTNTRIRALIRAAHGHLSRSASLGISLHMSGSAHDDMDVEVGNANSGVDALRGLLGPYLGRIRHLGLAGPVEWLNGLLRAPVPGVGVGGDGDGGGGRAAFASLESLKITYHPTKRAFTGNPSLGPIRIFTRPHAHTHGPAPLLRRVEIAYASGIAWKYLLRDTLDFPWGQITHLSLVHVVARAEDMQAVLGQCVVLEELVLSVVKAVDEPGPGGGGGWNGVGGGGGQWGVLGNGNVIGNANVNPFIGNAPPQAPGLIPIPAPIPVPIPIPHNPVIMGHLTIPSVTRLTLYNPRNFDYAKYLSGLRIHLPSVQHLTFILDTVDCKATSASGVATTDNHGPSSRPRGSSTHARRRNTNGNGNDTRDGPSPARDWSQAQFTSLTTSTLGSGGSLSPLSLLSLSTPAHVSSDDIERIMGEHAGLTSLDVFLGEPLSETTVRLMRQGYVGGVVEVLRCCVRRREVGGFLDMVEGRWVGRKRERARERERGVGVGYGGFRKVVVRCVGDEGEGNGEGADKGKEEEEEWNECLERVEEFQRVGRDVSLVLDAPCLDA